VPHVVDLDDVLILLSFFGTPSSEPVDVDESGFVDLQDLLDILRDFGVPCP